MVKDHPIDAALATVSHMPPEGRLEILWKAFENHSGEHLDKPPTAIQRLAAQAWLRSLRGEDSSPNYVTVGRQLRLLAALSVTEKASAMAQGRCPSCEVVVRADGTTPLALTTPIDVEPWSRQSMPNHSRIRQAVEAEMRRRDRYEPYADGPLCVQIISVVTRARKTMDVDNLVKGLVDALEGVLYKNDSQIQCLTNRRVTYNGPTGYYLLRVNAVHPYEADVVYDDGEPPRILSGSRVDFVAPMPGQAR